ncbi:MAG TPA: YceI family protein [Ignavibacteriales bacterium]|nr:YceI family protein [Ignavibacteriales bacterium]
MNFRALSFLILFVPSLLMATEYHVDRSAKNLVKFTSDAKFESFDGTTNNIDGYTYWEGSDILSNNVIYFEVDLRTLDTGIGLRNRHMREDYLETDKYPMASFKGKIVKAEKMPSGIFKVTAQGDMSIHGVTRPVEITGTLTPSSGDSYRIASNFDLKLSDYKIPIPQLMFMKISDQMKMTLDFTIKEFRK